MQFYSSTPGGYYKYYGEAILGYRRVATWIRILCTVACLSIKKSKIDIPDIYREELNIYLIKRLLLRKSQALSLFENLESEPINPFTLSKNLQFWNSLQDTLLMRRAHGLVAIVNITHGFGKGSGANGSNSTDCILVQQRIAANSHFNFGAFDQINRRVQLFELFQSVKRIFRRSVRRCRIRWKLTAAPDRLTFLDLDPSFAVPTTPQSPPCTCQWLALDS